MPRSARRGTRSSASRTARSSTGGGGGARNSIGSSGGSSSRRSIGGGGSNSHPNTSHIPIWTGTGIHNDSGGGGGSNFWSSRHDNHRPARKWIEMDVELVPGFVASRFVPVATLSEEELTKALERRKEKDRILHETFSSLPPEDAPLEDFPLQEPYSPRNNMQETKNVVARENDDVLIADTASDEIIQQRESIVTFPENPVTSVVDPPPGHPESGAMALTDEHRIIANASDQTTLAVGMNDTSVDIVMADNREVEVVSALCEKASDDMTGATPSEDPHARLYESSNDVREIPSVSKIVHAAINGSVENHDTTAKDTNIDGRSPSEVVRENGVSMGNGGSISDHNDGTIGATLTLSEGVDDTVAIDAAVVLDRMHLEGAESNESSTPPFKRQRTCSE